MMNQSAWYQRRRKSCLGRLLLAGMCMVWGGATALADVQTDTKDLLPHEKAVSLLDSRGKDPVGELRKLVREPGFNPNAVDRYSRSLLDLAAIFEHVDSLKLLLESGADVNANEGGRGDTVLMWANTKPIAELLLKHGADLNARNKAGQTALMVSLWRGRYEVADLFISKGLDVNDRDRRGETALMQAARDGRMKALCLLLSRKADPDLADDKGNTARSLAIENKHAQAVKLLSGKISVTEQEAINQLIDSLDRGKKDPAAQLRPWLEQGKLDPNMRDERGDPILRWFIAWNMKDSVKLLLDSGADVNARGSWRRDMPMVSARNVEMAQLLLDQGADLQARNDEGEGLVSAILYFYETEQVADFLLSKGLDVNDRAKKGETALMMAVRRGNVDKVRFLLSKGADPSLKNDEGLTAFDLAQRNDPHPRTDQIIKLLKSDPATLKPRIVAPEMDKAVALFKGRICTVKAVKDVLSEHNMDVNACDSEGVALLMWAIYYEQPQAVRYLIAQKADLNAQDNEGKTALMYAVENGDRDTVALLLGKGADPAIKDLAGKGAMDMMDQLDKKTRSQITRLIERAQNKAGTR